MISKIPSRFWDSTTLLLETALLPPHFSFQSPQRSLWKRVYDHLQQSGKASKKYRPGLKEYWYSERSRGRRWKKEKGTREERQRTPQGITRSQAPPAIALIAVCQIPLWLEGVLWWGLTREERLLSLPRWVFLPMWDPPKLSDIPSDRITSNFWSEACLSIWPWAAVMSRATW